jgi:hypothetical protein
MKCSIENCDDCSEPEICKVCVAGYFMKDGKCINYCIDYNQTINAKSSITSITSGTIESDNTTSTTSTIVNSTIASTNSTNP